jgi:hypothetical protein
LQATAAKPDQPQLDGLLYRVWERVQSLGKFSTRELCHFARRQKWRGEKMTAAAALDILKTIQNCGFGKLKDKVLYLEEPTAPPPMPPDPSPVTVVTEVEQRVTDLSNDCGQCGQVWSECPQSETQVETEIEADVVNCGQTQDVSEIEDSNHLLVEESVTASESTETVEAEPEVETEVTGNPPVQQVVQEVVVGSVVFWDKCPAHWESWAPFVVEHIYEDGSVKLEYVGNDYRIHISELRLAN